MSIAPQNPRERTKVLKKLGLNADGQQLSVAELAHLFSEEIVYAHEHGYLDDALNALAPN